MNNTVYKFNIFLLTLLTIESITSHYLAHLAYSESWFKNSENIYESKLYNGVFIFDLFRIILVGLFIFTFFADLINQKFSRKVKMIHACIALFLIGCWIYSLFFSSLFCNEYVNRILND